MRIIIVLEFYRWFVKLLPNGFAYLLHTKYKFIKNKANFLFSSKIGIVKINIVRINLAPLSSAVSKSS